MLFFVVVVVVVIVFMGSKFKLYFPNNFCQDIGSNTFHFNQLIVNSAFHKW